MRMPGMLWLRAKVRLRSMQMRPLQVCRTKEKESKEAKKSLI
jgi:hypothetical protein